VNRSSRLLLLIVLGCGDPSERDRSNGIAENGVPDLGPTYRAPGSILEIGQDAIEFAAQSLLYATTFSGANSLRSYGTVTEAADGRISYEAAPGDRLVIVQGSRRNEIALVEIDGSGSDVRTFLERDHQIRLRFVAGDRVTGEVWSSRNGTSREAGINGRVLVEDVWWNGDLRQSGREMFDVDQSGSRFFDDHELTGSIDGGGASAEVRQHWTFEMVSARDGIGSRMTAASSAIRLVNDIVSVGGQRYEWIDVRTKKTFRDGRPTELDTFWQGSGRIESNGQRIGDVGKFATIIDSRDGGFVGFQIMTAGGSIELERHQVY
jgi:hypothetical protein